jgi:hypothetical protein
MFKTHWYDSSLIESTDGFSVRWDRDHAVYEESGRKLTFTVDIGGGGADIFVDSISRWDDDPMYRIDAATRQRIAKNVQESFEWKGFATQLKT